MTAPKIDASTTQAITTSVRVTLDRNAQRIPPWQRRALTHLLSHGAQPFNRSVYGRRNADPASFIAAVTARALVGAGFATMNGEWISLTPRGRWYAGALVGRGGA